MEGKNILLLIDEKETMAWTYRSLASIGAEVFTVSTEKLLTRILRTEKIDLIYMDGKYQDFLNKELKSHPDIKIGMITRTSLKNLLPYLSTNSRIQNLVSFHKGPLPIDGRDIIIATRKLLDKDIFGLDKYLIPGVPIHKVVVKASNEKIKAIEKLMAFAERLGAKSRIQFIVGNIIDELLLNAIYDAPVDGNGQAKYAHSIGHDPVFLNEDEYVELHYASDGQYLYWAVRDNFGRLTRNHVHEYLKRCYSGGSDQVLMNTGGAGLGLYNIFTNINYFCANIEPGKLTEVIGMIDLSKSVRDLKKKYTSFHYFINER